MYIYMKYKTGGKHTVVQDDHGAALRLCPRKDFY
jgi:hypothetical protein